MDATTALVDRGLEPRQRHLLDQPGALGVVDEQRRRPGQRDLGQLHRGQPEGLTHQRIFTAERGRSDQPVVAVEGHVEAEPDQGADWMLLDGRRHPGLQVRAGADLERNLLIADEPTGNVDPDMAVRLLQLFEGLNRSGTTIVVATHDLHLMNRLPGAQMMRLSKGRVADPTGLLRYPPASRQIVEEGR